MRRIVNIVAVAVLMFITTSCHKESGESAKPEISFRSHIEHNRGGLVESEADIREQGLSLMGSVVVNGTRTLLIDYAHLAYDAVEGWGYGEPRYWAKGGKYHFMAIYPYDVADYDYDMSDGSVECIGYNAGSKHLNTDLLYAVATRDLSDINATPDYSAVDLPLKHACAAVEFRLRNSSNATVVAVTDVALVNVCAEGDFHLSNNGTATWTIDTDNRVTDHDIFGGVCTLPEGGLPVNVDYYHSIYDSRALTMLPQRVWKSGVTLRFNTRVEGSSTVFPHEVDLGNIATTTEWIAGKRYVYNLTLTDETMTFDVTVVDWIEDFIEL
ncbi:MAG: fimbrillin family protein [Alistipes sp.]|nr:fimbrillin family protein [Alistipes sp.]